MKLHTDISREHDGEHEIFGKKIGDLMRASTFTDVIFLLYRGMLPKDGERALLDAMLVSAVEHGIEVPSGFVPRVSVASGNSVHVAMAAGMLAMGEAHGGAGEASAHLLASTLDPRAIVEKYVKEKNPIPGFGHRIYKDEDPRATIIFQKAKASGVPLGAFQKAYAIEAELAEAKGKKLPLNIDGAFAAGTLSLGLPPAVAKVLFVLARTAGMGAHAVEEKKQDNGYARLTAHDTENT